MATGSAPDRRPSFAYTSTPASAASPAPDTEPVTPATPATPVPEAAAPRRSSLEVALDGTLDGMLDGTLALSLERSARVAAAALDAPAAFVALVGDDRRCFVGGQGLPGWFAHDPGVIVRSGLVAGVIAAGGPLAVEDARLEPGRGGAAVAAELGIAGYAAAPLVAPGGLVRGIFCVVDAAPRVWRERDLALIGDLAESAIAELELRRALSDRESVERQLRHDSRHDPLTGLPNRSFFMERLSHAVQRAKRRRGSLFAVLFLDLDNFKVVNDSVGHHAGDELLVEVARRLQRCTRGSDMVARLGGDEFALLLESVVDAAEAGHVAQRVQEALAEPVNLSGYEIFTSVSIGVALSSSANELPEYLLRSADMAMYRAKRGGRARFELFNRAMHADALKRLQLETDLRRAVERGEFSLRYQPVVDLATGRIAGVEALVRWDHPGRGTVSPTEFIPIAEETGLILPLGRWVLGEACRQVHAWHVKLGTPCTLLDENGEPDALTVGVNLSVKQFSQPDLVQQVARALEESSLEACCLKLEITESVVMEKTEAVTHALAALKHLGVQVHMDDFGTGYSSLGYLHRLPIDSIKIDRSFVGHMDTDNRTRQLVETIITLARNLGLRTVAEGVTADAQLHALRELGCTYAQGYLFSEPLAADELEALLREGRRW
ncbi:MAG: putative bifunctional diguanylate cyclase/phosphodiesterase [Gemmatimonadaceae bacterium]